MKPPGALETRDELKGLLDETRKIAVVGLSEKPGRESHAIALYLQQAGYGIVGINPSASRILGEPCFPSLADMPEETRSGIDLVAIFRRPDDAAKAAEEASRLGLKKVWFVPGAFSEAAKDFAERQGLTYVAERCLRTAHQWTRD